MVCPLVYSDQINTPILNKNYIEIRTAHHIFLESRHPEVTKNPYYVLSPKGSQKKVSAYGLIPVYRGVYIHYFKINPPTFCCPLFSENYLNPQDRINKTINKHTADYRLSYSYGFLSALSLLSLSWYIPPQLWKSFKFIVLRLHL